MNLLAMTGDTDQRGETYLSTSYDTATTLPLTESDLAKFAELKISSSLLAEAGVLRVNDSEARTKYGIKASPSQNLDGIIFPYFSVVDGHRTTARLRRDHPEIDAKTGKPKNKYIAPYGDPRHLYFPPDVKAKQNDPSIPIVLVEAEKSVLALTAWGTRTGTNILPLGLGGCWGWSGRKGIEVSPKGERVETRGPLDDLRHCAGRTVYLLFDTNVATNPRVRQARNALVKALRELAAGRVLTCDLPTIPDCNGPDDFVSLRGDVAMAEVFGSARAHEGRNQAGNRAEVEAQAARRGYLKMPHALLQHGPALGPYGLAVALVLADHADSQGVCWPSIQRIMKMSGIGAQATVVKQIRTLRDLGILSIQQTQRGFIKSPTYRFESWSEPSSPISLDETDTISRRESAPFHPMKPNKNHRKRTNSAGGKKSIPRSLSPVNSEPSISSRETVMGFIEGETVPAEEVEIQKIPATKIENSEIPISLRETVNKFIEGEL